MGSNRGASCRRDNNSFTELQQHVKLLLVRHVLQQDVVDHKTFPTNHVQRI